MPPDIPSDLPFHLPGNLYLLRPAWLLALVPLAALLLALAVRRRQAAAWRGLVDPHLLPHLLAGAPGACAGNGARLPLVLLGIGWTLAVLALAGPAWERLPQPVYSAQAARVILLDLSASMNAADLRPSRLARGRFEALDLLRASEEGQVALIAYGPEPFVVSPLTGDARTIADQVPQLASGLIPVPGPRRLDRALALAGELLAQAHAERGQVLVLADGLGEAGGDRVAALAAARELAAAGHRVSVLGLGTEAGAPVPNPDGGFAQLGDGAITFARLDRAGLAALAAAGKGHYVDLAPGDRDTQALLGEGSGPVGGPSGARGAVEETGLKADRWREEGPWLLLALLPLAALAFRRGWLLPAVLAAVVLPPVPGLAQGQAASGADRSVSSSAAGSDAAGGAGPAGQPAGDGDRGWSGALAAAWQDLWERPDRRAARAFAAGDHASAAAGFADPAWRAAARYRSGDYAGALADLTGLDGPEADYNRGNALARLGRLDAAIAAYERALSQDPDHADARANLALVQELKDRARPPEQGSQAPASGEESGPDASGSPGGPGGAEAPPERASQPSGGDSQDAGQGGSPGGRAGQAGAPSAQGSEAAQADASAQSRADTQPGSQAGADSPAGTAPDDGPGGAEGERIGTAGAGSDGAPERPGAPGAEPRPGDLGASALAQEAAGALSPAGEGAQGIPAGSPAADGARRPGAPGSGDLLPSPDLDPAERERLQSLEAQLRRVPDDPAGLLRQRFMLQHLRRQGQLP